MSRRRANYAGSGRRRAPEQPRGERRPATGERRAQHRVRGHVRARSGDRRRDRRPRRGAGRAVARRRLVPASAARCCSIWRTHVEETGAESVRDALRAAWKHISAVPALRALLLTQAVALVFFARCAPIEVVYAKSTLHAGDRGYGVLLGRWGARRGARSVVFARSIRRSLGPLLTLGTLAGRPRLSRFRGRADARRRLRGSGRRRGRQRHPVGVADQRRAASSRRRPARPADERGRIARRALPGARASSLGGAIAALSSPRVAFLVAGAVRPGDDRVHAPAAGPSSSPSETATSGARRHGRRHRARAWARRSEPRSHELGARTLRTTPARPLSTTLPAVTR